jgi:ligand-binding sensor domain-containing protein
MAHNDNLYCATTGGLAVFSLETNTFTRTIKNTEGLRSNRVYRCLLDKNSNLWLGTHKGLAVFDSSLNNFLGYHILGTGKSNIITALNIVGDTILVGTHFGLFAVFTKGTNSLADDEIFPILLPSNFSKNIFSIYCGDEILIGACPGLIKLDNDFSIISTYFHPFGDSVKAIRLINDTIYIATELGIAFFDNETFTPLFNIPAPSRVFDLGYYNNNFYLATIQGLWEFNGLNAQLVFNEDTRAILTKNGLWLGCGGDVSRGGGLKYFFNGHWQEYRCPGIEYNTITCAIVDNQGSLYALHYPVGYRAISYKPSNGSWQVLWDTIPNSYVAVVDQNNNIWFGHWILNGGLSCYDPYRNLWKDIKQWTGLQGVVGALGVDLMNNLWFHNQLNSIIAYNRENFYEFTIPGLSRPERYGYELLFDNQNRLWLGFSGGLAMLDYKNTLFNIVDDEYAIFTKGLPANKEINSIAITLNNQIWCATNYGIAVLEGDSFKLLDSLNLLLINNQVKRIRTDKYGGIWILTPHGLSYYNLFTGQYKEYTPDNSGVIPNDDEDDKFYQWLFCDPNNPRLLIATKEGLCEFFFSLDTFIDFQNVIVYPNPFINSLHSKIVFRNLPRHCQIRILDFQGRLVECLVLQPNTNFIEWTPQRLPPGIYFARLSDPLKNSYSVIKLAIIN